MHKLPIRRYYRRNIVDYFDRPAVEVLEAAKNHKNPHRPAKVHQTEERDKMQQRWTTILRRRMPSGTQGNATSSRRGCGVKKNV